MPGSNRESIPFGSSPVMLAARRAPARPDTCSTRGSSAARDVVGIRLIQRSV